MNNVGILAIGPVEEIPLEAWQRVIDVNLLSVVRSNLVFLPLLLAQGRGHVVNTASTAGLLPYGFDRLPYTATKHADRRTVRVPRPVPAPPRDRRDLPLPAGVATNIVEQITFYGEPRPLVAPKLPIVEASEVGELVADAIVEDRFLLLTAPEVIDELRARAADHDAYLSKALSESP